MLDALPHAILELAEGRLPTGIPMGELVDILVRRGYEPTQVEGEIWAMLGTRALTPSGFVCRVVRRRDGDGTPRQARTYELLLIPWSKEDDERHP